MRQERDRERCNKKGVERWDKKGMERDGTRKG